MSVVPCSYAVTQLLVMAGHMDMLQLHRASGLTVRVERPSGSSDNENGGLDKFSPGTRGNHKTCPEQTLHSSHTKLSLTSGEARGGEGGGGAERGGGLASR